MSKASTWSCRTLLQSCSLNISSVLLCLLVPCPVLPISHSMGHRLLKSAPSALSGPGICLLRYRFARTMLCFGSFSMQGALRPPCFEALQSLALCRAEQRCCNSCPWLLAPKVMDYEEYLPPSALDHHMGEDCCYFYILPSFCSCLCPCQAPSIDLFLLPCPNYFNADLHCGRGAAVLSLVLLS